jgi:cell wall-associated NlpC family hydrolase
MAGISYYITSMSKAMLRTFFSGTFFFFISAALVGCASAPVKRVTGYTPVIGEKAAHTAATMIGRPYKFKGDSPSGFDCSGLVRYSYLTAGLNVPHGTKQLKSATRSVDTGMQKGDLIFFNEKGGRYSHVGIYVGGDSFVHAPSTGKNVRKNSLLEPYWKKHFIEARRFF